MVLVDGREGKVAQGVFLYQGGPDPRMGFHHVIFRFGEFAALAQDAIRDADFADVVQETAQPSQKDHLRRQSGRFGQSLGILGNPPEMPTGVSIAGFDHGCHQGQGPQQRFFDLDFHPLSSPTHPSIHRLTLDVNPFH